MTETFGDQQWGTAHFNQKTGVTVAEIMDPDPLHAGLFASIHHQTI